MPSSSTTGPWRQGGPPTPVLALSFLLAGLGTVVLGPLLPQLTQEWHLRDERSGLLLLAKFVGAFAGGALVPRFLRLGIVAGHLLAAVGFAFFAEAAGLRLALPALALTGFGLGQMIASTNILTGQRWPRGTGAALALLNFFWSLGAVATGLLVAALAPRFGWRGPVLGLSTLLAVTGVLSAASSKSPSPLSTPVIVGESPPVPFAIKARFGTLLFLYGGLETCLTAWLTTFSLRLAGGHLLGGQSGFVVLWLALTAGRLLASSLMRRFPELGVQRGSLILCFVLVAALLEVRSAGALAVLCILLGLALAPVFPSTFALLLDHPVAPRVAGFLLALSGLGAALFPYLMGLVSTLSGSLRWAMLVPLLLLPSMLALARRAASAEVRRPAS